MTMKWNWALYHLGARCQFQKIGQWWPALILKFQKHAKSSKSHNFGKDHHILLPIIKTVDSFPDHHNDPLAPESHIIRRGFSSYSISSDQFLRAETCPAGIDWSKKSSGIDCHWFDSITTNLRDRPSVFGPCSPARSWRHSARLPFDCRMGVKSWLDSVNNFHFSMPDRRAKITHFLWSRIWMLCWALRFDLMSPRFCIPLIFHLFH
jgi:hypothetical protein